MTPQAPLRNKIGIELGALVVLTIGFLVVFPKRNLLVDFSLAGFALVLVGLSAKHTRLNIWAVAAPPPAKGSFKRSWRVAMLFTVPVLLAFLGIGMIMANRHGGWEGVRSRILNPRMLVAFGLYLPWALMQQTLFQFYLLGRLLVLFSTTPRWVILTLTGMSYSLVHLPDIRTTLVTAGAGVVWSHLYYRYRALSPLAFSHAALGTTFYSWVCGRDLGLEWAKLLQFAGEAQGR